MLNIVYIQILMHTMHIIFSSIWESYDFVENSNLDHLNPYMHL